MHKFKFEPPQQHRRSLQQPKNDHLTIINTLDKCTQILREDRLFLRNEIKNGNQQILELFKQFSRPAQLQNLQIRLRKYVQTFKNRIKNQQLNKFKETLHLNMNENVPQIKREGKRQNNQLKTNHSHSKQQNFKPNSSVQFVRNGTFKSSQSQQHHSQLSQLNLNSSLNNLQLLKYKYNQEIIEQRQSQNVTSARLARPQNQPTRIKPLQQQYFDTIQNKISGKTKLNNYGQVNKKLEQKLDFMSHISKQRTKITQQENQTHTWKLEKDNNKASNQYLKNNTEQKYFEDIDISYSSKLKNNEQAAFENIQDSIFDKHFNQSEKGSSQYDQNEQVNSSMPFNLLDVKNSMPISSIESNKYINDLKQYSSSVQPQQPRTKYSENEMKLRNESHRDSESQNLFTPLQLLNECRNFLKHRQNSLKKSKIATFQESESLLLNNITSPHGLNECLFNRNNIKEEQSMRKSNVKQFRKQQESNFDFPQILQSRKRVEEQPQKVNNQYHYVHFETFANTNDQRPNRNQYHQAIQMEIEEKIPEDFSIEDMLQQLMELSDVNPFITTKTLLTYVNRENSSFLKKILKKELSMMQNEQICIVSLAETLNKCYNQTYQKHYPCDDQTINSVYSVLDIDAKGYINKEDINSFLSQIEDAEVENYDEVAQSLWRLFDGSDFTNQHQLTYWHFFVVKNSEQFDSVKDLLSQFEFEIERNN